MKLTETIAVLKNPEILNYELNKFNEEQIDLQRTIDMTFDHEEKRQLISKRIKIISKAFEIISYVKNKRIDNIPLCNMCLKFLSNQIKEKSKFNMDTTKLKEMRKEIKDNKKNNASSSFDRKSEFAISDIEENIDESLTIDLDLPKINIEEQDSYMNFKKAKAPTHEVKENHLETSDNLDALCNKNVICENIGNSSVIPGIKYSQKKEIPSKMLIGSNAIDISKGYYLDYLNEGNLLIESSNFEEDNSSIDNFIVAYIFKVIEQFPLGRAQFYIIDKNEVWYYTKFENNMNSTNSNNLCKNLVKCYNNSSMFFENAFKVKRRETQNKMNMQINSIYDLMNADSEETMKFIIIRDCLNGLDSNALKTLESAMVPNETAHRCGFRFLTISDKKREKDEHNNILKKFYKNSQIVIEVESDSFRINGELINQLRLEEETNSFISTASLQLFNTLTAIGKAKLKYEDIYPKDSVCKPLTSPIVRIPVGREGSKIIELPFSANNNDGTAEGSVVNYMVIGSTGSGKSSLMHSIIINGARKYSPNDLIFWVLDFKDGVETSKYKNASIPHIDILAERNTQEDALYLFHMIDDEIANRTQLFAGCKDICEYNKKMDDQHKPHIPHIIVLIDEAQEIVEQKDADEYSTIGAQIKAGLRSCSSRVRAFGIHLVLIAQNLSSNNNNFSSSYLPQALGRVTFTMDNNALADANFGSSFNELRDEICKLSAGQCYIGFNQTMHKAKIAYASDTKPYLDEIREKFSAYKDMPTRIIGDNSKLYLSTPIKHFIKDKNYKNKIYKIDNKKIDSQKAILGENSYTLYPSELKFSSESNSSLLILGDPIKMSTSIFRTISMSLVNGNNDIYLINNDKTTFRDMNTGKNYGNHLTNYWNNHSKLKNNIYTVKEFNKILGKVYKEYIERENQKESSNENIEFKPIYLMINDISSSISFDPKSFVIIDEDNPSKDISDNKCENDTNDSVQNFFEKWATTNVTQESIQVSQTNDNFESVDCLKALKEIISNGHTVSIYIILSVIGEPTKNIENLFDSFGRFILYNNVSYHFSAISKAFSMLTSIKNPDEETQAIVVDLKKPIEKIRPILYEHND